MIYSGSGSPLSSMILFSNLLASIFSMFQSSITSHRAETVYEYDTIRDSKPKATIWMIFIRFNHSCMRRCLGYLQHSLSFRAAALRRAGCESASVIRYDDWILRGRSPSLAKLLGVGNAWQCDHELRRQRRVGETYTNNEIANVVHMVGGVVSGRIPVYTMQKRRHLLLKILTLKCRESGTCR